MNFELASGSIIGTDHVFSRKNNQDAYYLVQGPDVIVGVVCDGCGDPTSPHSEVGAHLAARQIANALGRVSIFGYHFGDDCLDEDLAYLRSEVVDLLTDITARGSMMSEPDKYIVRDYCLFTILGFCINPTWATFFGIGDGTLYVNGEKIQLGPFPNNTPPYLAYSMLDSSLLTTDPGSLEFTVYYECPTQILDNFLIGSDGAGEIERRQADLLPNRKGYLGSSSQFWTDGKYFSNPQAVNRKLALANTPHQEILWEQRTVQKHGGLLSDDTTIICGRKKNDS